MSRRMRSGNSSALPNRRRRGSIRAIHCWNEAANETGSDATQAPHDPRIDMISAIELSLCSSDIHKTD